jgi:hypothetical protein
MRASLGAVLTVVGLVLTGCFLLPPTEIDRQVHALYDGDKLLVITSSYATPTPDRPYFADTNATDWSYSAEERSADGATAGEVLFTVVEDFTAGGSVEYSPIYWDAKQQVVSVADWNGPYIVKGSGSAWTRHMLERPALLLELADFSVEASAFAPLDVVLSPDGSAVAVLWQFAYLEDDAFSDLLFNDVISFYSATDGSFLYGRRVQAAPAGGSDAAQLGPVPADTSFGPHRAYDVASDAAIWNRLIWQADGSAVYLVAPTQGEAVRLAYDPNAAQSTAPMPETPATVPDRATPSDSGPVKDDGLAAVITIPEQSNTTELSFVTVTGWEPFASQSLVDLSEVRY